MKWEKRGDDESRECEFMGGGYDKPASEFLRLADRIAENLDKIAGELKRLNDGREYAMRRKNIRLKKNQQQQAQQQKQMFTEPDNEEKP